MTNNLKEDNGVKFQVVGDNLDSESALLISNHLSLNDHLVIEYLVQKVSLQQDNEKELAQFTLPRVNFFTWFTTWKIPTLKMFFNIARCDENWELETELNHQVFDKIRKSKTPEWVVVFPEVNIFTKEAVKIHNEMSDKYYLVKLKNLLYPRFSGFYNAVQLLQDTAFSRLYDITIVYYKNPRVPDFTEPALLEESTPLLEPMVTPKPSFFSRFRAPKEKDPIDLNTLLSETSATSMVTAPTHFPANTLKPNGDFIEPTLFELFAVKPSNFVIHIHVKSKLLRRIPKRRHKLEKWLESHWNDKDKFINTMQTEIISEISASS